MKKPFEFMASEKPFTVQLDQPCVVTGYTQGDLAASFYRPFQVKKGDTFKAAPGGLILNGAFRSVKAHGLKSMKWKVSWVAKRLRVAVFKDRDRIWNRRTRKPTNRFGKPYWSAVDLRSYHVGCAETADQAIKNLLWQCQATNLCAAEEEAKGHTVIRWRCLLPKNEALEMEQKARKTGFILNGLEVPPLPAKWQRDLERLRRKAKATS